MLLLVQVHKVERLIRQYMFPRVIRQYMFPRESRARMNKSPVAQVTGDISRHGTSHGQVEARAALGFYDGETYCSRTGSNVWAHIMGTLNGASALSNRMLGLFS
jgi:hypothetical protein